MAKHEAPRRGSPRREPWIVLAAALMLWVAAGMTAGFGLDLSDEGYIVYPSAQVASGLIPYRDINTLYTPLPWYLHAALFKLVGVELIPLRWLFAGLAASLAVGVYVLGRHFLPWYLAVVSALSFVLVFPIPQTWAPYPAWYAMGALMLAWLAMARWLHDPRAGWLLTAGAACAVSFACKSSLGIFGAIGICAFLVLQVQPLRRVGGAESSKAQSPTSHNGIAPSAVLALHVGALALLLGAFWLLLRENTTPGNLALFLGSTGLAGATLLEAPRRLPWREVLGVSAARVAWVAAGFVAVTLPWYTLLSTAAGWELTFDAIFRNGARTAWAFYLPVFSPNADAIETLGWIGLGALMVAAAAWARGRPTRGRMLLGAVLAALLLGTAVVVWRATRIGLDPFSYVGLNLATRLERTASEERDFLMYLPWVAVWLTSGLLLWRKWRAAPVDVYALRLRLLVWLVALILLQLYPRASHLHVLFSIAPALVLVGVLRGELWRWSAERLGRVGKVAAFAALLIFPGVVVPAAARARLEVLAQSYLIGLPHAGVRTSRDAADQLDFVAQHLASLPPGAPVFVYPVIPTVYLFTDHPNPTRENYLPPGFVDEARQRAAIERLEQTQTRYVVWDHDLVTRWGLYASDRVLPDYLWSAYRPVAAKHSWILLERIGS